jgi:hypothetical protein
MNNRRVGIDEQRALGLRREHYPANYVPATPEPVKLEVMPPYEASLHVEHPAKMQTVVTTSAVDRGKSFQLMITPISLVLAVLAVIVAMAFETEFFSFATLLIFWLTFAVVYVLGMCLTALATPEFVSWYSARRQWDIIEREQKERWGHYKRLTGAFEDDRRVIDPEGNLGGLRAFLADYGPWLVVGGVAYGAFAVLLLLSLGG